MLDVRFDYSAGTTNFRHDAFFYDPCHLFTAHETSSRLNLTFVSTLNGGEGGSKIVNFTSRTREFGFIKLTYSKFPIIRWANIYTVGVLWFVLFRFKFLSFQNSRIFYFAPYFNSFSVRPFINFLNFHWFLYRFKIPGFFNLSSNFKCFTVKFHQTYEKLSIFPRGPKRTYNICYRVRLHSKRAKIFGTP